MVDTLKDWHKQNKHRSLPQPDIPEEHSDSALPPIIHDPEDSEGWTTVDEPLLFVYAGKGPYVGR